MEIRRTNPIIREMEKMEKEYADIAAAMTQDRLIDEVGDKFSSKTTFEEWNGVVSSLKWVLHFFHAASALSAFMGVFSVGVVFFALMPFTDILIGKFSIAEILAIPLTIVVLYAIEKGKEVSIFKAIPKFMDKNLRTEQKADLPFLGILVFVMVGISFVTSFFGGIETPAAVTKEPERVQAKLIDATGTTEKSLASVEKVTESYDTQIAAAEKEKTELENGKTRNENTAKAKRRANGNDTGWREQMAANKATGQIRSVQDRIDKLIADKQAAILAASSLASAGLSTIKQANDIELAETTATNEKNKQDYVSKITKSRWAMGALSLFSDFAILLIYILILKYQHRCGIEFGIIKKRLEQAKTGEKQPLKQTLITNEAQNVGDLVAAGTGEKAAQKIRMSKAEFLASIKDCDIAADYGGKTYTPAEIGTYLNNIAVYYGRINKPIKEGVTGENAAAAQEAKVQNAAKVKNWTAILSNAGVEAIESEGALKLLYPYK